MVNAAVAAAPADGTVIAIATAEAGTEDSVAAARSASSAIALVTMLGTARREPTAATGATARVTSLKTATRAPTLRRATTATSRVTLPARAPMRLANLARIGVSPSPATIATRWDTYPGTARTTQRLATSVTSPATSAVIAIRKVESNCSSPKKIVYFPLVLGVWYF